MVRLSKILIEVLQVIILVHQMLTGNDLPHDSTSKSLTEVIGSFIELYKLLSSLSIREAFNMGWV
jgi:hypothetical protein